MTRDPHLQLRIQLTRALRELIQDSGLRQREAAMLFGVAQPRVSDLVRGKVGLFSIDTLVDMLAAGGVSVELVLHHRKDQRRGDTGRQAGRQASSPRDRGRQRRKGEAEGPRGA